MKTPKTLQFIVGLAVIYFAWQLAQAGWFDRAGNLFRNSSYDRGLGGGLSDLALDILPYLIDTVCLFGAVAIAMYGFILRATKPLAVKLAILLDKNLEKFGYDLYELQDNELPAKKLDVPVLENTLGDLLDRVKRLEESK